MIQEILTYFDAMIETEASDLYLTAGSRPTMRVDDALEAIGEAILAEKHIQNIISSLLSLRQVSEFEMHKELNTAIDAGDKGRYRINVMQQRQKPALVIRRIVTKIPDFDTLRLPPVSEKLALMKQGLVLFTGMTGSGKSTSLASILDYRNTHRAGHIITIEDPIEFFHEYKQSVVTPREVGVDTESYEAALKNVLRQRPDVIMIGEIRSREVMEQALTAAETGHLCFATLHTNNTYQAIDRIVNFFPEELQSQICLNLSLNLRAIVSQRLIPSLQGGLALASEVLLNEGYIKTLIHEGKIKEILGVMSKNSVQGMQTFDGSLLELYREGVISEESALTFADIPGDLKVKLKESGMKNSDEGSGLGAIDTTLLSISE